MVDPLAIFIAGVVAVAGVSIAVLVPHADKVSKKYNAELAEAFKRDKDDEYELDGEMKVLEMVVHRYMLKHPTDRTFKDKFLNALVGNDPSIIQEIKNRCEKELERSERLERAIMEIPIPSCDTMERRIQKNRSMTEFFINVDGYFAYIKELMKEGKLHPNIEAAAKFLRDAGALKG